MISLHPVPAATNATCPICSGVLSADNWHIVGVRTFIDRTCQQCGRAYHHDLPVGHGLYNPILTEADVSQHTRTQNHQANWYDKEWLSMIAQRTHASIKLERDDKSEIDPAKPVVILNTIDSYYGHSLLKLLNAQYYLDHHPNHQLIIIVQPFMRWLVPEGVSAVWVAHIPLREASRWYEDLDRQLHDLITPLADVSISVAFSHPDARDFDIERFSRTKPFDPGKWFDITPLTVTFIWRDDRLWQNPIPIGRLRNIFMRRPDGITQQAQRFAQLATILRQQMPTIQIAIVGSRTIAQNNLPPIPDWVTDLRVERIDRTTEQRWVEQYARSHFVVGVHGSNMLLPTAHAGASIALMPVDRWGNVVQDTIVAERDPRIAQVRYKHIPVDTYPETLARIIMRTSRAMQHLITLYGHDYTDHARIMDNWHNAIESIRQNY